MPRVTPRERMRGVPLLALLLVVPLVAPEPAALEIPGRTHFVRDSTRAASPPPATPRGHPAPEDDGIVNVSSWVLEPTARPRGPETTDAASAPSWPPPPALSGPSRPPSGAPPSSDAPDGSTDTGEGSGAPPPLEAPPAPAPDPADETAPGVPSEPAGPPAPPEGETPAEIGVACLLCVTLRLPDLGLA